MRRAGALEGRAGPSPQAPFVHARPAALQSLTWDVPHRNSCPWNFKQDFNSKANPEPSAQEEAGQRQQANTGWAVSQGELSGANGSALWSACPAARAFPRAAPHLCQGAWRALRACTVPRLAGRPPGQGSPPSAGGGSMGRGHSADGQAGWMKHGGAKRPEAGPGSGRGPQEGPVETVPQLQDFQRDKISKSSSSESKNLSSRSTSEESRRNKTIPH